MHGIKQISKRVATWSQCLTSEDRIILWMQTTMRMQNVLAFSHSIVVGHILRQNNAIRLEPLLPLFFW